jgi:hypothetical protein
MNKSGMYDYGLIQEGSYFGDISAMLNTQNEFSYLYNPNSDKPLLLLTIPTLKFLEIVNKFPAVKETLTMRAKKRIITFRNFKQIALMRYMRFIRSNPTYIKPHIKEEVEQFILSNEIKIKFIHLLVIDYDLLRWKNKIENKEQKIKNGNLRIDSDTEEEFENGKMD